MNYLIGKEKKHFPTRSGWMVFIIGLVATLVLTYREYRSLQNQKKEVFKIEISNIQKNIKSRLVQYENVLIQARAFFLNSKAVTRAEFAKYVEDALLLKKYPGFLNLGYTEVFYPHNLSASIAKIRELGFKNYKIWPEAPRDVYHGIVFFEPLTSQNIHVIGYDMFTNSLRREAMERARDSGQAILTKKIRLIQKIINSNEQYQAIILYCPLYRPNTKIGTTKERRENLKGFIFSSFLPEELFNSIFANTDLQINFEIYDGPVMNAQSLLYDHDKKPHFLKKNHNPDLEDISILKINGQDYHLYANSTPEFEYVKSFSYLGILLGGGMLTILLTWIVVVSKRQEEESLSRVRELQEVQQNLLTSQNALREAIDTRDEFISIASHELKNPMTSLKLQAQLLQRQLRRAQDLNEYRERIEKALVRVDDQISSLNRLVEDMLDISRMRTGKLKMITSEFNMADVIRDSVDALSELVRTEGYPPIVVEINGNLNGVWDKVRMEQLVNNLLTNAIRYGNKKTITIKGWELEHTIRVSVQDQGIGISKIDQERIFDRFERATSTNEDSGLGVGLFISLHIIEAHHGKIWVESEVGKGAVFTFELPKSN